MTSENCPQCEKKLAPPFKSSGRQVCSGCGWTNQLKSTVKSETTAKPKSKQSISLPALKFSKRILIISGSSLAILILGIGGLASWSETRVACSTKSGEPAYKALKNIHNEWEDTVELASSSSRMSLPPQIARLQEVKRKLKTQEWRDCAEPAVELLVGWSGS